MGKRRLSREVAVQLLYQLDVTHENIMAIMEAVLDDRSQSFPPDVWQYARQLLTGTVSRMSEIDGIISLYSEHWDIDRICLVDRNIIRLAIYEMIYAESSVPANVCINEAIEIAKKFSSDIAPSFVNGILDRVKAEHLKEATP